MQPGPQSPIFPPARTPAERCYEEMRPLLGQMSSMASNLQSALLIAVKTGYLEETTIAELYTAINKMVDESLSLVALLARMEREERSRYDQAKNVPLPRQRNAPIQKRHLSSVPAHEKGTKA